MTERVVLFSLSRELAKRMFGAKTETEVQAGLAFVKDETSRLDPNRICDLDQAWKTLHACLNIDARDGIADGPALSQAISGGRKLAHGEDIIVGIVRPDIARQIPQSLGEITEADLRARYELIPSEKEPFEAIWKQLQAMCAFYTGVAERGDAVMVVG